METLASRIAREGGLQEVDAVGWAIRVARRVEQIHASGRVHGRLSAEGVQTAESPCTSEGWLIPFAELPENVAYHSPERERGEGGSQADDAWAVAVILYFALSGSLPFSGATDDEVRRKIRTVPAPPLAVFDVGDDDLQAIVDRALARNRDARTANVAALRRELEAWHPDLGLHELPPLAAQEDADEDVTIIHSGGVTDLRKAIEAAMRPPSKQAALPRLVDEVSVGEEPGDPFALPASRAEVRALGANAPTSPGHVAPAPPAPAAASPSVAPVPPARPAAPRRRAPNSAAIAAVVAVVAGVAAILGWTQLSTPRVPTMEDSSALVPRAAAPAATATAAAVVPASATQAPAAPPPARPEASATAPGSNGLAACVVPLFPPESFDPSADFSAVCSETDPLKVGGALRTELVRAHRNISDGMREWALLGWYELPAVALVRSRCCPSAKPLEFPEARGCTPIGDVLATLVRSAEAGADPSDKAAHDAVDGYTHEVYCIVRGGTATRFGRRNKPEGGEDTTFSHFLARFMKNKR